MAGLGGMAGPPILANEGPEVPPSHEPAGCAETSGASVGYAPISSEVEDIGEGVGTVEGVEGTT